MAFFFCYMNIIHLLMLTLWTHNGKMLLKKGRWMLTVNRTKLSSKDRDVETRFTVGLWSPCGWSSSMYVYLQGQGVWWGGSGMLPAASMQWVLLCWSTDPLQKCLCLPCDPPTVASQVPCQGFLPSILLSPPFFYT